MLFRGVVKIYTADLIQLTKFKKNCYVGKICSKYGGTNFSYGIFIPNPGELC